MTQARKATGRAGEDLAAAHLLREGYRVLCRNFRSQLGELDIIAEDGDTVVFVEVRTRHSPSPVLPEETVNTPKMRRLVRLAEQYMSTQIREDRPWRVDVVAVELSPGGAVQRIELFQDALSDVARGW